MGVKTEYETADCPASVTPDDIDGWKLVIGGRTGASIAITGTRDELYLFARRIVDLVDYGTTEPVPS